MESKSKLIETTDKPSEDIQVAGHPNSLIFNKEKLYKKASDTEIEFYNWLYSPTCPETIKELLNYIPKFYGIETINESKYLILENLNFNCENANVMDCKLGKITWKKNASPEKIERKKLNNAKSTTNSVGFRISGMIIKDSEGNVTDRINMKNTFDLVKDKNDLKDYFKKFVSENGEIKRSVLEFVLLQVKNLLLFFRKQSEKNFLAASLFFVFGKNNIKQLKLIDFANVEDSEGALDNNVIEALEEMLSIWGNLS